MTYATEEASESDGAPIELYKFVGTSTTFWYTSSENNITFSDGGGPEVYVAIPIKRSGVTVEPDGGAPQISVTMSVTQAIAAEYVFQVAPPDLHLTIYRMHEGSSFNIVLWEGDVLTWSVDRDEVTFVIPNELVARVQEELPRVRYQSYCNNVLYDDVCTLTRTGNQEVTTIASFSSNRTTVNVVSMGARASAWAHGGELVHTASGESRMVIDHSGTALQIIYAFSPEVDVTDGVTVYAGCDHTLSDCDSRFASPNVDNFNGMPFILSQALNPTQSGE